jgi:choline dehydrogenase
MELRSPDPLKPPAFHPNYLSEPGDIRRSLAGMRKLRQIAQTEPLASRIVGEITPGPEAVTDEQRSCRIWWRATPMRHAS